ncbi:MAG: TRAP transporter permease, partial [Planctomycetota bacterium]
MARSKNNRDADKIVVAVISTAWALFQLALPRFVILDSITVRAVHLAFAVTLIFLTLPARRRKRMQQMLTVSSRVRLINYILAGLACLSALYIVFDWIGISMRAGMPIARDVFISVILIGLLLEASRRVIGPALAIIAIVFTLYAFLG